MPVSTGSLGEPRAKRCKLCDESKHRSEPGSGYWQLQLDADLVDTISAIYPEWFKGNMAEPKTPSQRESPPKAVIDTSPILIDQNKESLKVKLLLRRPFDQLVAQGIMPPHKTPAAYHGQRRQLERAKTGDMLKAKIQQRPPRQELERRHILEADPNHLDPSLAEKQRMLKKARLADQLNDQLSHRPGPLELIQKNILHTEEPIEQAVKTGRIPYKATSEGQLNRPQHPQSYETPEEDSQSSDDVVSSSDVLETAAKSAGIVVSLLQPERLKDNEVMFVATPLLSQASASSPASLVSSTSTLSPLSSVASPVPSIASQPATPAPPPPPISLVRSIPSPAAKSDAPGKDKNRKKAKSKSAPKTRTIKFHEYKGPPSAQKSSSASSPGESSYDLLLKQQTLLLQFQLQLQHKYPQIILPGPQKSDLNNQQASPAASTCSETSQVRLGRLEDMKVSDLKTELKRRGLPVSGSKPQLIERLRPFMAELEVEEEAGSPEGKEEDKMELDPASPKEDKTKEEIVLEQQRQIEELQRELTISQLKLQAAQRAEPKAQLIALQKHLQARQQQQQQQQNIALQMKQLAEQTKSQNEEQLRLQQQQHVAFQNQKNLNGLVLNGTEAQFMLNQLLQGKVKLVNGHNRANSLPGFFGGTGEAKTELIEDVKPPPQYEEATKKKNSVKSQIVDDVLEILIKNGELPPSAANDPATPSSAGTKSEPPQFVENQQEGELGLDPGELLDGLDNLDNMDFSQLVMELGQNGENNNQAQPMDTDDDWLESLLPSDETYGGSSLQESGFDPLLGIAQEPFDPFLEEFRSGGDLSALSWDKLDYAA